MIIPCSKVLLSQGSCNIGTLEVGGSVSSVEITCSGSLLASLGLTLILFPGAGSITSMFTQGLHYLSCP